MKLRIALCSLSASLLLAMGSNAQGQILYSQDFDVDDTANWSVYDGPTDEYADFFFDYSTVGIPSAPNSTGGSTRALRVASNIHGPALDDIGVFGGFTVSPNGQAFSGDYTVKFDMWANYIGAFDSVNPGAGSGGILAGATGSSTLSIMGILSSGTAANYAGAADGLFFAATPDGGSGADYRAYSAERAISYQIPPLAPDEAIDMHATYFAGSRNNTNAYYTTAFPGGDAVPAAQTAASIDGDNLGDTQYGVTPAGSIGFKWRAVEISKVGNTVTWSIDGTPLIAVDVSAPAVPFGGENLILGQGDINAGLSTDPNFEHVQFTLFDNIVVERPSAAMDNADFDGSNLVDGADFLKWQQNNGINDGSASLADGDANDDGNVDAADLTIFQTQYGTDPTPTVAAVGAVPEPTSLALVALTAVGALALRRRA